MTLFEASVEVAAPPAAVWATLLDWEGTERWMVPPTTVSVLGDQRLGIGTRLYAVTTVVRAVRLVDHMVVTEWVPEREIRVRHVGWIVRGDGIFRVTPVPGGTRFGWIEDMPLPMGVIGEIIGWVFRRFVERSLRRSCGNLARVTLEHA